MKVLAISGSLRRDSLNTRLLRAAAELAPSGVEVELLDPSVVKELPIYDPDDDGVAPPVAARRLRGAIRLADAILIATPEYNGSIPGGLKNAIDWASRPYGENALKHKPTAVVGASSSASPGPKCSRTSSPSARPTRPSVRTGASSSPS
ncbi:MAG: NAD(P)H-dependent oxidoreductase [Actinobacteria bacterium]|nr:MAG: NAD(P)H-dependent oxidoreductase [Actinomycetota bacterium]